MGKIKISELDKSTSLKGFYTIGTDSNNESVQVSLEFVGTEADRAKTNADAAATATTNANTATANAEAATAAAEAATAAAKTATTNANEATTKANTAAANADTATANANTATANAETAATTATDKIAELQDVLNRLAIDNHFIGFARQNGATSPGAETTYGTKALIHEIGKHFRMATVKNGKVQHYLVGNRLTKATNGDDVAIDGSDGDVMWICDTPIQLLKATCDVEGVETNCIGLGLVPCYWQNVMSKTLPKFGISPVDVVNCKLSDDYRSCAHSIYNTNVAGSHSNAQGLLVQSYKTSGNGYATQWVPAVESIKQAQNKNEDALTNRPYTGLYYEFYEALLVMMFAEVGSVNIGSNTSFGAGVTCAETPTASTFVGSSIYANSGFQVTCADGTQSYYNAMPYGSVTVGGVNKGNGYLNGSISLEYYNQIPMLEGQRVLDGIMKNGWTDKINTNDNIFYFGSDGELQLTTSTDVNLSTGEGMTDCTRYYVARDVPNCEGMSDGVMTAVVNVYTKMTFADNCAFAGKDVSNGICIAKQSLPIYRGFALPFTGHFRQLSGTHLVIKVDADGNISQDYCFADSVADVPALTTFGTDSYQGDVDSITPIERGLSNIYAIPFSGTDGWVSKDNYSLSMLAATERSSASRVTKECRYFWNNYSNNVGTGTRQVHASAVGCYANNVVASVRSLHANVHAGSGVNVYAGAFAVLLTD